MLICPFDPMGSLHFFAHGLTATGQPVTWLSPKVTYFVYFVYFVLQAIENLRQIPDFPAAPH
jgi:hypothetical protein